MCSIWIEICFGPNLLKFFCYRERAHLEFPEGIEVPSNKEKEGSDDEDDDDDDDKKKKKKKKKKKEKKEKRKGTLVLKQPKVVKEEKPEYGKKPEFTGKRLKRDKFAWSNDDVYDNSKI